MICRREIDDKRRPEQEAGHGSAHDLRPDARLRSDAFVQCTNLTRSRRSRVEGSLAIPVPRAVQLEFFLPTQRHVPGIQLLHAQQIFAGGLELARQHQEHLSIDRIAGRRARCDLFEIAPRIGGAT